MAADAGHHEETSTRPPIRRPRVSFKDRLLDDGAELWNPSRIMLLEKIRLSDESNDSKRFIRAKFPNLKDAIIKTIPDAAMPGYIDDLTRSRFRKNFSIIARPTDSIW